VIDPFSTLVATSGWSRLASRSLLATQGFLLPRTSAIAATLIWSSSRRDAMTRASTMGLVVLRGALASRRSAFCSGRGRGLSKTTATRSMPVCRHRSRRLKPSSTS
jgi:hypothetical protein